MFGHNVDLLILTIVLYALLEGSSGAGRVGDHHPVRAGALRSPPCPDIDEGIGGPAIVAAIRG